MPFSDLMRDTISLIKEDGTKVSGLKASVQGKKIHMMAGALLIESGDLIQRTMSNGGEETYQVIDPHFHEEFHGIPANYQMDVKKLGVPEAKQAIQSITYNITGNNARINQNSVDSSTNVVQIDTRCLEHIAALRAEINQLPPEKIAPAIEIVDAVEEQIKLGNPKKSVVSALLSSLPHLEKITAIVGNILDTLS